MSSFRSFNGSRSPSSRSNGFPSLPLSPFSTSPSQLQEVTLDQDASIYSMGLRSPVLGTRGRSVKEIEEQLTTLRKENFNLKLRIYFLEERMGTNFTMDQENAVKRNIELMVELEGLKKEVQEKQDLLCQAVKAMDLEEDEHKKITEDKDKQLRETKVQLESLRQRFDMLQDDVATRSSLDHRQPLGPDMPMGYLDMCCDSKNVISRLEEQISSLQEQLRSERQNNIQNCTPKSSRTTTKVNVDELQLALNEKEDKLAEVTSELEEKCQLILEAHSRLEGLENELEERDAKMATYKASMDAKETECKDLRGDLEETGRRAEELLTMYEHECRKNEKNKLAIANRNAKIVELENAIETYKGRIGNLESKLETAVNEVNSSKGSNNNSNAAEHRRSPPGKQRKANFTDSATLSVRGAPSLADNPSAPKSLGGSSTNTTTITTGNIRSTQNSKSSSSSLHHQQQQQQQQQQVQQQVQQTQNVSGRMSAGDDEDTAVKSHGSGEQQQQQAEQVGKYKKRIEQMQKEQMKACKIIQKMIGDRQHGEKEIEQLQNSLQKKDVQLAELREKLKGFEGGAKATKEDKKMGLQARISELNLTAAAPASDTERFGGIVKIDEEGNHLVMAQNNQVKPQTNDEWINERIILLDSVKEKSQQLQVLEQKYDGLKRELKDRENKIVDLVELLNGGEDNGDGDDSNNSSREKIDEGTEKVSFWIKESEDKDREIEKLERELAQRTQDLQGIVNNELWQKNLEIGKLLKHVAQSETKDSEIAELRKEISNRENQLKILFARIADMEKTNTTMSLDRLESVQEKLDACNEERNALLMEIDELNQQVAALHKETITLKTALDQTRTLHANANDLCQVLGNRLEELALFLDYLLKQKNVLGLLGSKNKWLKDKIEESLDLSKSLSHNLSLNPEDTLLQLSNISHLLNDTDNNCTKNISVSFAQEETTNVCDEHSFNYADKTMDQQGYVIKILRNQVSNLKKEIEVRDRELNKRLNERNERNSKDFLKDFALLSATSNEDQLQSRKKCLDKHLLDSESESWSEPDRSVSKARIGLDCCHELKPKLSKSPKSESTETRTPPSRTTPSKKTALINQLNEQIASLEAAFCEKDQKLLRTSTHNEQLQQKLTELLGKYNGLDAKYQTVDRRCQDLDKEYKILNNQHKVLEAQLESERERFEATVLENRSLRQTIEGLEEELKRVLNKKCALENEVILLKGKVGNLEEFQRMLTDSMDTKTKLVQNRLNEIEVEKSRAQEAAKSAQIKLDDANKEVSHLAEKLLNIEITHAENTTRIIKEAESEVERITKDIEEKYDRKLQIIESTQQRKIAEIVEAANKQAQLYETDYVQRAELERLTAMIKELEEMKVVLKLSEERVVTLSASECFLKEKCLQLERDHGQKIQDLRTELDKATLLHSQLVLEKTQLEEHRCELENQVKHNTNCQALFAKQAADLKNDLDTLQKNFNRQIGKKETQCRHLEAKISVLESRNAELQNKIIRNNVGTTGGGCKSAPTSPNGCRILDLYLSKNHTTTNPIYSNHNLTDHLSKEVFSFIQHSASQHKPDSKAEQESAAVERERLQSNSSPDLGIESDQGRYSSLEVAQPPTAPPRPFMEPLELSVNLNEGLGRSQGDLVDNNKRNFCQNENCLTAAKDLREENHTLRKRLEHTLSTIKGANQKKREVEKKICRQLEKTTKVLQIAKTNLDSGSENELAALK